MVEQANLHPRPEEVDVFLAMDEHGAGVHGRSGSRPLAWTSAKIPPLHAPDGPGEKLKIGAHVHTWLSPLLRTPWIETNLTHDSVGPYSRSLNVFIAVDNLRQRFCAGWPPLVASAWRWRNSCTDSSIPSDFLARVDTRISLPCPSLSFGVQLSDGVGRKMDVRGAGGGW